MFSSQIVILVLIEETKMNNPNLPLGVVDGFQHLWNGVPIVTDSEALIDDDGQVRNLWFTPVKTIDNTPIYYKANVIRFLKNHTSQLVKENEGEYWEKIEMIKNCTMPMKELMSILSPF